MIEQVLKSIISYVVPAILGFLIAKVVNYRKKNDSLKTGVMTMLQSNISNTYFLYEPLKTMPDYLYRNVLNQYNAYTNLGGNDYVKNLMSKMEKWEITRTDVIKKH